MKKSGCVRGSQTGVDREQDIRARQGRNRQIGGLLLNQQDRFPHRVSKRPKPAISLSNRSSSLWGGMCGTTATLPHNIVEVIPQETLDDEGHSKSPDYVFRVGQTPKFYTEAKKPAVNIKDDPAPAYQLRRYSWSAKLPLSILTNFEEFAVFECHTRPAQSDKAEQGPHLVFHVRGIRRPLARDLGCVLPRGGVGRAVRPVHRIDARQTRHIDGGRRIPERDRGLARRARPKHRHAESRASNRRN